MVIMAQTFVLVGRTTNEVELKQTQGGTSVASFTVACDRYNAKKLKEDGKQSTDFFNCISFNKQAEYLANNLRKGKLVEIHGEVQIDVVKGDDDKNRYFTKVICSRANVLEYEKKTEQTANDDFVYEATDIGDDCPF